jgi:hypothetical protein
MPGTTPESSLADNLVANTPSPQDASRTTGAAAPSGTTAGPAQDAATKYAGKTREEIIEMHRSAEQRFGQQSDEVNQLRHFARSVSPFFKVEGDSVSLNDAVLKKYAETQGWLGKSTPPQSPARSSASNGDGLPDGDEEYDDDAKMIRKLIRQELQGVRDEFKTSIEPIQSQFYQHQHNTWIEGLRSKYQDFDSFRPKIFEFLNQTGFKVQNAQDLEKAYIATKAVNGGMIDKMEADRHIGELEKTLQNVDHGSGRARQDVDKISNAELLGMDTPETPESKIMMALTGKPRYD